MQTTQQSATPAAGKPVKVFHATRNTQMEFDASVSPDYAVAYAFCEENQRLSELFSHRQDDKLPALYARLPMVRGMQSVACGDWMACVPSASLPANAATPVDIRPVPASAGGAKH